MAGGAAAAVCGARIGSRIAKTGAARRMMVTAQDDIVDSFLNIFSHCQGSSHERLQRAMMRIPQTTKGIQFNVVFPSKEDLDFLAKVADINHDAEVSDQEATFAFRVWLCWKKLYPRINAMFEGLDKDGNGTLDAAELEPYMTKLNDGEEVAPAEVLSVIHRADSNGDGSLDKAELTFATAVWYTDIDRKKIQAQKLQNRVSRKSREIRKKAHGHATSFLGAWRRCSFQCCCRLRSRRSIAASSAARGSDTPDYDNPLHIFDGSGDPGRPSTGSEWSEEGSFHLGRASQGTERSDPRSSSSSEPTAVRVLDSLPEEKEGAGVGNLDDAEQAKLASELSKHVIIPARNKDNSIRTDAATTASLSPPCENAGFDGTQSETWSLDRGYPDAPALLIINTSDNAELMHDNFTPSPSEMAVERVGL